MSTQNTTTCHTFKAAADLSLSQYRFVEVTAAQTVNACNAITDVAVGVLQNDPNAAGLAAVVAIGGTTKVVAGAAIAAGARVAPTAVGKAQTAASTQFPIGIALDAAGADGDVIEILLMPTSAAAIV